jgi:hypothetical protein
MRAWKMKTPTSGKTIRLACDECDRDDMDGITYAELLAAKKAGWKGVIRVQTYAQSLKTYDHPADEPPGYSILDWMTHIGDCPECEAAKLATAPRGG